MKEVRFTVDDVNRFWKDNMFYFLVGKYISGDTLAEENDYKISYQKLKDILEGLKSDKCIIPEKDRQKNIKRVSECMTLLQTEYGINFKKELVL